MEDKSGLVLKLQPGSKTGYLGVIEVKGKFQGRLQVKGDGRGGVRKRKQYSLPVLFDTPKDRRPQSRLPSSRVQAGCGRTRVRREGRPAGAAAAGAPQAACKEAGAAAAVAEEQVRGNPLPPAPFRTAARRFLTMCDSD